MHVKIIVSSREPISKRRQMVDMHKLGKVQNARKHKQHYKSYKSYIKKPNSKCFQRIAPMITLPSCTENNNEGRKAEHSICAVYSCSFKI